MAAMAALEVGLMGHEIRKAEEAVRKVEHSLPPLAEQVGYSDFGFEKNMVLIELYSMTVMTIMNLLIVDC